MDNRRRFVGFIRGNAEELNRELIRSEFSKFDKVTKIFTSADSGFAKVYTENKNCLEQACRELNNTNGWKISFTQDTYGKSNANETVDSRNTKPDKKTNFSRDLNSSTASSGSLAAEIKMDDYMYDDCTVLSGFVDLHGNDLDVLEGAGKFYVSLADVRRTGFSIFKKDEYIPEVIDNRQKLREFELYLLSEGKRYLLSNQIKLKEEEILDTIERVKSRLLGKGPVPQENGVPGPQGSSPRQFGRDRQGNVQRRPQEQPGGFQANIGGGQNRPQEKQRQPYEFNRQGAKQLDNKFNVAPNRFQQQPPKNQQQQQQGGFGNDRNGPRDKPQSAFPKGGFGDQPHLRKPAAAQSSPFAANNDEKEEAWDEDGTKGAAAAARGGGKQRDGGKRTSPPLEPVDRIKLKPNTECSVKVSYLMERSEKSPIYYVNLIENSALLEQLLVDVNTDVESLPTITPEVGKLCIAEYDGVWYRAHVVSTGPTRIDLIDYGNREVTNSPVKKIPDSLKSIPAQCVRCTINGDPSQRKNINLEDVIVIMPKRQYDDGTYIIELREEPPKPAKPDVPAEPPKKVEEPEEPTEKVFMSGSMKPAMKLKHDDKVMIVDVQDGVFYVRNKECALNMKEMKEYIEAMEKKPLSAVKPGQLVLCSKDSLLGVHRAEVVKVDGVVTTVAYVDYTGTEQLSLKSLRNVDEHLSSVPRLLMAGPRVDCLADLGERPARFLENVFAEKTKFTAELEGGKFDLTLKNESLIDTLRKLNEDEEEAKPEPVKLAETPAEKKNDIVKPEPVRAEPVKSAAVRSPEKSDGRTMFSSMPTIPVRPGRARFMLYTVDDEDVTLLSTEEEHADHLAAVLSYRPDEAAAAPPYDPAEFEMCLALYEDVWSRATPTAVAGGLYELLFVDFGNTETRRAGEMRRLPDELAKIPILGINASFTGIPKNKLVYDKLKSLIADGDIYEVEIKSVDKEIMKCSIEVPKIYEELKKCGLM